MTWLAMATATISLWGHAEGARIYKTAYLSCMNATHFESPGVHAAACERQAQDSVRALLGTTPDSHAAPLLTLDERRG